MKITENLKKKLRLAKAQGYSRVYAVCAGYKSTTYCRFHNINSLLGSSVGFETEGGRIAGPYAGWPNTRQATCDDIQYSRLWRLN